MRMNWRRTALLVILLVSSAAISRAQSSAELKKQREKLNREIELVSKELQHTSSDRQLSLKQVNALTSQIRLRERKIGTINSEIGLINNEMYRNTKMIRELQEQLAKLKKDYANMVLFAFRNQNAYNKLMFIFASDDFNRAYKRVKYLQQFSDSRKHQAKEIAATQQEIEKKQAQLEANKAEKAALLGDQQQEKQELDKQKGVQSKVLNNLTAQEKQYKQELDRKRQEDGRLARAIQAAIRREIEEERRRAEAAARAAAEKEGKTPDEAAKVVRKSDRELLAATPEAAKLSADFAGNRGRLPWPVEHGTVVQGFGLHTYGRNVTINNTGLSIRTNEGAPVRAVFEGDVLSVTSMQGVYAVIIRHGRYFSVYSKLRSVSVQRGQKVTVKQPIGVSSTDPEEGVAEIQFEIWEGTAPINPTPWLAGN